VVAALAGDWQARGKKRRAGPAGDRSLLVERKRQPALPVGRNSSLLLARGRRPRVAMLPPRHRVAGQPWQRPPARPVGVSSSLAGYSFVPPPALRRRAPLAATPSRTGSDGHDNPVAWSAYSAISSAFRAFRVAARPRRRIPALLGVVVRHDRSDFFPPTEPLVREWSLQKRLVQSLGQAIVSPR